MEVCFGACSLFKKLKFSLPLVKQNAPEACIMKMAVSKRYKVEPCNYSSLMTIMEKILLGIFFITSQGYFLITLFLIMQTFFHDKFRTQNTNKLVHSVIQCLWRVCNPPRILEFLCSVLSSEKRHSGL